MAHEAGIRFTMDDVVVIMRRTPYIADPKPGGKYVAFDVHNVGGIPVIIKALLGGDCMTVTGKSPAENHKDVVFPTNRDVIYPVSSPISPTGGVVCLKGTLAPDGAIVKIAGLHALRFEGTPSASTPRKKPSPPSMPAPPPRTRPVFTTSIRRDAPSGDPYQLMRCVTQWKLNPAGIT